MSDAAPSLFGDIGRAGVGLWRLIKFDPNWAEGFDASTGGFIRSFAAPLLSLPLYLMVASVLGRDADGGDRLVMSAGLELVAGAIAYPLVMAVMARAFDVGEGYGAFIVVTNWSQLFLNIVLTASSALAFAGDGGLAVFRFIWLMLLLTSIYVTWRAARQTLSTEVAPALLSVVLAVAISAGASQLSDRLVG